MTKALFSGTKEEKRMAAKKASFEVLGMGMNRFINWLSDRGLICSLVIQAPYNGGITRSASSMRRIVWAWCYSSMKICGK